MLTLLRKDAIMIARRYVAWDSFLPPPLARRCVVDPAFALIAIDRAFAFFFSTCVIVIQKDEPERANRAIHATTSPAHCFEPNTP